MSLSCLRRLGLVGGVVLAMAIVVVGCGGPQPPPPPGTAPGVGGQPSAGGAVTILPGYSYASYANRGIEGWQATRSADGRSLSCSYRAGGAAGAHYGGVGIPMIGGKQFSLTVTFQKGAPSVKQVMVTELGPKGAEVARWGRSMKAPKLANGTPYSWSFNPGGAPPSGFWVIRGNAPSRNFVHLFMDTAPGAQVQFSVSAEGA